MYTWDLQYRWCSCFSTANTCCESKRIELQASNSYCENQGAKGTGDPPGAANKGDNSSVRNSESESERDSDGQAGMNSVQEPTCTAETRKSGRYKARDTGTAVQGTKGHKKSRWQTKCTRAAEQPQHNFTILKKRPHSGTGSASCINVYKCVCACQSGGEVTRSIAILPITGTAQTSSYTFTRTYSFQPASCTMGDLAKWDRKEEAWVQDQARKQKRTG